MKMYSYILFDWDGCLAKTLDIWLLAYKETFNEYGITLEDRTITNDVFGNWNNPKKFGILDIDEFTEKLLVRLNSKYPTVGLYDNVFSTIKELKNKGKKLALITTTKRAVIEPALKYNKLETLFDVILTAEDVEKHKPDPEVVNKALEKLEATRENSIIIGDSKSDLGAGNNADIDSILFYPKHNELFYDLDTLKTHNPTYIVNDFSDILDYIK